MRKIIYKTNDEIEANMIKHSLENRNIEVFFEHEDLKGVFDGLSSSVSTMHILVNEIDYSKAMKVIDEIKKNNEELTNGDKPNKTESTQFSKLVIFGIIIFLIISGIIVYSYRYKIFFYFFPKSIPDPLYTFKWNKSEKCSYSYWKSSGKIASKYFDINLNYIYEKSLFYNQNGLIREEYIDENENGITEKYKAYNKNGEVVIIEKDLNEDGFPDERIEIFKNKMTRKIIFKDGDFIK